MCVYLSVHHLALNSHGISIIFLTWEKWVRGQLPRHEVVKDEKGPASQRKKEKTLKKREKIGKGQQVERACRI